MFVKKKKHEEADKEYEPGQEETDEETSEEEEDQEKFESSESEEYTPPDSQQFIKNIKKKSKKQDKTEPPVVKPLKKRKIPDQEHDPEPEQKDSKKSKITKDQNEEKDVNSGKKKSVFLFNDKNVDVNLFNEAPQNIKVKKVKLNNNLILQCHVIDASDSKMSFNNDFPALSFIKKMKDGKAFQFSIPFNLGPTVQSAIQIMVDANPQFFSGIKKFKQTID